MTEQTALPGCRGGRMGARTNPSSHRVVKGMGAMTGTAKFFKYTAFTLMTLFGVLGGLFAAGYAFEDLELALAIGLTAAWVVPMIGLSVFALRAHDLAPRVFVGLTALAVLLTLFDSAVGLVPRDDVGPVASIAVLVLGVGLASLGLRRASLAGLLMVVLALGQFAATLLGHLGEWTGGEGPGMGDMLGGSSGVVVAPVLMAGVLFLAAGALAHDSLKSWHLPVHPAH